MSDGFLLGFHKKYIQEKGIFSRILPTFNECILDVWRFFSQMITKIGSIFLLKRKVDCKKIILWNFYCYIFFFSSLYHNWIFCSRFYEISEIPFLMHFRSFLSLYFKSHSLKVFSVKKKKKKSVVLFMRNSGSDQYWHFLILFNTFLKLLLS